MLPRRTFWLLVALVLLLGLALRLPGISSRSLWIDELYSLWFAERSFVELWTVVPKFETHPPVYYSLLRTGMLTFGNSELAVRSLSLIASLATILVVAVTGHLLRRGPTVELAGIIGGALLAANYASIRDAQNARPYALQVLVTTLAISAAILLVSRLLRKPDLADATGWKIPALILSVAGGCLLWLHNISLFICFGLWAGMIITLALTPAHKRLRNAAIFVGTGVLALLIWTPYLPIFLNQLTAFMGLAFWLEPKPRDLYSAWMLIMGESVWALAISLTLLALGLWKISQRSLPLASLVATVLLVPLYLVLAVSSSIKPIYIQRLFAWEVPLALSIMVFGALTLAHRRWIGYGLVLLLLAVSLERTVRDYDRPIDDWKAISSEIAENAQPGDVVIASPAEGSIAVDYYAGRHANFPPIVCIPGCYPQRDLPRTYMSNLGAPRLIAEDAAIVRQALKNHRRVWLVQVSVQLYDPKNIVRSTIASERTFVRYFGNSLARVDLFE